MFCAKLYTLAYFCLLGMVSHTWGDTPTLWNDEKVNRLKTNWDQNAIDLSENKKAWNVLQSVISEAPSVSRPLRVFYLTFNQEAPYEDYQERYHYILHHLQAYFADQLVANGFPSLYFDLEYGENGKLLIHSLAIPEDVRNLSKQQIKEIGDKSINDYLKKLGLNWNQENLLIIYALPDGVSPYEGKGNTKNGQARACDIPGIAPIHLSCDPNSQDKEKREKARQSGIHLGGMAHSLAGSLGLFHTRENLRNESFGESLTAWGNYSYAKQARGEGKGTFLDPSNAIMLISHPLLIKKQVSDVVPESKVVDWQELTIQEDQGNIHVKGRLRHPQSIYGIVIYSDPPGTQDYDATATSHSIDNTGEFDVTLPKRKIRPFEDIRIVLLYADGTKHVTTIPIWYRDGKIQSPLLSELTLMKSVARNWRAGNKLACRQELEAMVKQSPSADEQEWIKRWMRKLDSETQVRTLKPSEQGDKKTISLVDAKPDLAQVGWGVPLWDNLMQPHASLFPYFLGVGIPDRYIFMHAPASIIYDLGGLWDTFDARVGMLAGNRGTITFSIYVDGKKVEETPVLSDGASVPIHISVKGAKTLSIQTGPSNDGNGFDWGIIGDPVLIKN